MVPSGDFLSGDRVSIRLFLFFLLLFSFFAHWGADNAYSRYDLTRAMVEDQGLKITPYAGNTIDKRVLGLEYRDVEHLVPENGSIKKRRVVDEIYRYAQNSSEASFYTDKAPYSSFLAVPGYLIGDLFTEDPGPRGNSLTLFLILFTVSVVPGAALMVLLYRYMAGWLEDRKAGFYTTLAAGTGTFLAYNSTVFKGVITAAFFLFLSFYLMERKSGVRWTTAAGLMAGFAVGTEYYAALALPFLAIYEFMERDLETVLHLGLGIFLGLIPLFIYNYLTTGNPLMVVYLKGIVQDVMLKAVASGRTVNIMYLRYSGLPGYGVLRVLNRLVRLLVYPVRGVFFYSPLLLLGFFGARELYQRDRWILGVMGGIPLSFILFQAAFPNWLAGASFGPRYFVVSLPFMVPLVGLAIRRILKEGLLLRTGLLVLVAVSLFQVSTGFHGIPVPPEAGVYERRMNTFKPVQPGFYGELVERNLITGPRSEVMAGMLSDRPVDLNYDFFYAPGSLRIGETDSGYLLFRTPVIPLVFVSGLTLLLLGSYLPASLRVLTLAVVLMGFLGGLHVSHIDFHGGVYLTPGGRVLTEEAQASVRVPPGGAIGLELFDFRDTDPVVEVSKNGEDVRVLNLTSRRHFYLTEGFDNGADSLDLEVRGCSGRKSGGPWCEEVILSSVKIFRSSELHFMTAHGWELKEGRRYMSRRGVILLRGNGKMRISAVMAPVEGLEEINLTISTEGKVLRELKLEGPRRIRLKFNFTGIQRYVLSTGECSQKSFDGGKRCVSIYLEDLLIRRQDVPVHGSR
ncbi:MAG: ArnT family glycosyltransferase [Candidatus Nanohaloarchaea archaeon]